MLDVRCSMFISFFFDLPGRLFGQRRRLYETKFNSEPQNRRTAEPQNNECRRVGSLRSVFFYKIDRLHYFDIRFFTVSFSIWLAAVQASGGAHMKLHFKNWSWLHPGTLCFCRLGWTYSSLCWVSLHSTQPTFCRCNCEMRNPTTADFRTESPKFLIRLDWFFFGPAAPLVWNFII